MKRFSTDAAMLPENVTLRLIEMREQVATDAAIGMPEEPHDA